MSTTIFDDKAVQAALARLNGDARVSLARSMGVAGGQVYRDTAKALAPVKTGRLKDSIYLAFKDRMSNNNAVTYGITWNHRVAPHGHLVEFGHWQPFKAYLGKDGEWYTNTSAPHAPKWIAAHAFLRPAFDSAESLAKTAMLARGRERLPELLREAKA